MKATFRIIVDPKLKGKPLVIRQDDPGPETPAVVVPEDPETPHDSGPPDQDEQKPC